MTIPQGGHDENAKRRQRAEAIARRKGTESLGDREALSLEETQRALHELQVRRLEEENEFTVQLLVQINSAIDLRTLMRGTTGLLREWAGCEAVGVRLREGEDFPYFETSGFPAAFVQAENKLCTTDPGGELSRDSQGNPVLECMCGNVLCGRFDRSKPFFTARGSFWTNSTTQFLATTSEADRQARTRNRCHGEGYESVALIAVPSGGEVIGLLQFNDLKPGRFTLERILLLERLADHLAVALAHRRAEEALRQSEERFEAIANYAVDWESWFGPDGRLLWVNPAVERFTGYTAAECRSQPDFPMDSVFEADRESFRQRLDGARRGSRGENFEFRIVHKGGQVIWGAASWQPIFDQASHSLGFRSSVRDITERKRMEAALRESEDRYRRITEGTTDYVYNVRVQDGHPVETRHGPACETVTGYRPQEFVDDSYLWIRIVPEADRGLVVECIRQILEGEQIPPIEHRIVKKDGEIRWVRDTSVLHKDASGNLLSYDGVIKDITERKQAEDKLHYFAAIVQSSDDAIIGKDLDGHILSWNMGAERMYGYLAQEMIGRSISILVPRDHTNELSAIMAKLKRGESVEHFRTIRVRKDAQLIYISLTVSPIKEGNGRMVGASSIARDITEAIRAEEELRASENRFLAFMNNSPTLSWAKDEQGRIVFLNQACRVSLGIGERDYLGKTDAELWPAEIAEGYQKHDRTVLETDRPLEIIEEAQGPDGRTTYALVVKFPFRDAVGRRFVGGVAVDITERKRAEESLRESERRLRLATEAAGLGMWDWNLRTGIIIWSEGHARLFGLKLDEFDGRYETFQQCIHADDLAGVEAAIRQARESNTEFQHEFRVRWPDGSEHWIMGRGHFLLDEQGELFRMLGVVQDFTRRKQLEAQFQQAHKMEAVGQLAGGVAHDFNNILAATIMNLNLLENDPNITADMRESILELGRDAKRAASLTRQLLLFSCRQIAAQKVLDLNEVLENLLKMLRRLLGEHIEIFFQIGNKALRIEADPGMMEQVVMNLCVNARDAMPKGGRLMLRTHRVEVDAAHAQRNPEARAGGFAMLAVQDEGCGMDAETLKRIFEPFFTTKDVGKGTGLGLATVYGIVKQHNGWVEVASQVGKGTVFRVYLPLANKAAEASAQADGQNQPVGGSEAILLVEDEPSVRRITAVFLRSLGYTVWEAGNGVEAMRLWRQHRSCIRLLFTDMVMPEGMTGLDLAELLRAQQSGLPVIISSGYSIGLLGQTGKTVVGITYLPKPCDPDQLARTLRHCLNPDREDKS